VLFSKKVRLPRLPPYEERVKCGAVCRDGHPCGRAAEYDRWTGRPVPVRTKGARPRCRFHRGDGPKTEEGKANHAEGARRQHLRRRLARELVEAGEWSQEAFLVEVERRGIGRVGRRGRGGRQERSVLEDPMLRKIVPELGSGTTGLARVPAARVSLGGGREQAARQLAALFAEKRR